MNSYADRYCALLYGTFECPECGDPGPHDDNGCSGERKAFACAGCGTHFDVDGIAEMLASDYIEATG